MCVLKYVDDPVFVMVFYYLDFVSLIEFVESFDFVSVAAVVAVFSDAAFPFVVTVALFETV